MNRSEAIEQTATSKADAIRHSVRLRFIFSAPSQRDEASPTSDLDLFIDYDPASSLQRLRSHRHQTPSSEDEASRSIPDELENARPEIPWPRVKAIGNVLRHEYHGLSDRIIWGVIVDELPKIRIAVEAIQRQVDQA